MRAEGIFLTEAGAKSITVGLRELGELLLGGHLHGSRAGGAGVERLAHEGAGRAEGKGEGDGGELHGLKENLRGVMVGVSARRDGLRTGRRRVVECMCVRVEAAAAVGSGQAGGESHRTLKGAREGRSLQEIWLNREGRK